MQIKQISVTGLFGIFDHVIPLNMNDRITIVHGPNGFGKTAMLRLLNGFINSQYSVFWTIPFNNFQILFDNNSCVKIAKNQDKLEKKDNKEQITFNLYNPDSEKLYSFPLELVSNRRSSGASIGISDNPSGIRRTNSRNWSYIVPSNENIDRSENGVISKFKLQNEPEWLTNLKQNIHVRLIESQRLLNVVTKRSSKSQLGVYPLTSSMLSTVAAYSSEIAQLMRDKFTEYGVISQSLDRTFPSRLVQRKSYPNLTDEQLRHRLEELETTRSRLIEVGLLDEKIENTDFPVQPPAMDESTKNILSVYVDDVEKKLSVFNDIASKIYLLQEIINSKFAYKKLSFSKRRGFVFQISRQSSFSDSDTLSPTDLSSGEQHELVLLYELLFKVEPKSLVLIDEPELSLHVGWQVQFLKDLQDIVKLADLDIMMATHSPDIIQDRWDLTVELQGIKK